MTAKNRVYSRGELAKSSGVNAENIRYYEKIAIMPEPPRSPAGYRQYGKQHLQRLLFIRRSRELGFSLNEVRELLDLVDGDGYSCAEVKRRTISHLVDVQTKIKDLQRMRTTLKKMVASCDGGLLPDCPIVDALISVEDE